MPNWCHNTIDIYGEHEELKKFQEACQVKDKETGEAFVSLNHLFPCPEELLNTTAGWFGEEEKQTELVIKQKSNLEKYGYKDWYDWANGEWGTKWGARDVWLGELSPGETFITGTYDTAWSPADGLIKQISALFPTLLFSVVSTEESDAFVCYSIFKEGKLKAEDGEVPEIPSEIAKLADENNDSFYDELSEWQTNYFDSWNLKAQDKVLELLKSK